LNAIEVREHLICDDLLEVIQYGHGTMN